MCFRKTKRFSKRNWVPGEVHEQKHTKKENVSPRLYKPRPVPYAMRKKVETEMERLTKQGIIEPVKFSEWVAPIMPVLKQCTFVVTKTSPLIVSKLEQYPIPKLEELFEKLLGMRSLAN